MWIVYLQGIVMGLLAMVGIIWISMRLVSEQMGLDAIARSKIPRKVKYRMGDMVGRRNSK